MNFRNEWNQLLIISGIKFIYEEQLGRYQLTDIYENNRFIINVLIEATDLKGYNEKFFETMPPSKERLLKILKAHSGKNSEAM